MSAPRISQKLAGKAKGRRTNTATGGFEIDPNKLGSITLNRDAIQALTIAQARVQVSISAGGTTAVLVSEETGKQIGGLEDLSKLLGLRAFVTKEKKASASSELQDQVLTAAYRASAKVKADDPDFVQKKLDNAFVLAAKPYKLLADLIDEKAKAIMDNYHEGSETWKEILLVYCSGIKAAAAGVLEAMVKGEKEKGLLEHLLLEKGVPSYIKNKLQLKSLVVTKDMDLSRILFPQDPSKGISLTVKEWLDPGFVRAQGQMMKRSGAIIRILGDAELVQELVQLSAEEMNNAEDPRVQRVFKTRILVIPPFEGFDRVLEPLSRPNFRGFGLPATAMDQSKDRLSNLCAVFVRAYAFSVRMAETIPDYFDRIFPKGTISPPDTKLGNYAKQALDNLALGVECNLHDVIDLKVDLATIMAWIDRECKIIPDGKLHNAIRNVLSKRGGGTASVIPCWAEKCRRRPSIRIDMVSPISTGAEKDAFKSFRDVALAIKDKGQKNRKTVASSVLSKNARAFLKSVARDHSHVLSQSMEGYFRGFYSESIQTAAVKIAEARFDDLDELSEPDSSDDDSSDGEESD